MGTMLTVCVACRTGVTALKKTGKDMAKCITGGAGLCVCVTEWRRFDTF
jgi:hypothetical protein